MRMNYILEPSLQYTTLVTVAAILWNQDDIKNLLSEFNFDNDVKFQPSSWKKIEAIVVEKVAQLPLPKQIKEKISCYIRPVGLQIKQWKHYLYNNCSVSQDLPNVLCWTSQGTIDKKKTAQLIIKQEDIDIIIRYSLACIHCLEDDIPKLWDKIPKRDRISLHNTPDNYVLPLIEFWTNFIKKNKRKMNRMIEKAVGWKVPVYLYAFETAAVDGYTIAAEYFLKKLRKTVGEVDLESLAVEIASEDELGYEYAETLCFLLSYLDKEEQITVFKSNPSQILTSLLDYPFQHFFMGTANYMWNVLEKDDYAYVLNGIVFKIKHGYKDFDYQKLLGEFWQKIPFHHKRDGKSLFYSTIRDLFEIGDENNIRLIFKDATPEEKKSLFYHDIAQDICKSLLNGDDPLNLLKYFIRECLPSKDEVIQFKEHLECGEMGEFQFKFFHALDEVIGEFKKRKLEEEDYSQAKKVCSAEVNGVTQCADK